MRIFADRMGKLFRENPIQIAFPEAVNLFSARSKFVHEASQKSTVRLWNVFLPGDSCVIRDDKICLHNRHPFFTTDLIMRTLSKASNTAAVSFSLILLSLLPKLLHFKFITSFNDKFRLRGEKGKPQLSPLSHEDDVDLASG